MFKKRVSHKNQEDNGINIFYEEYIIPQALTQVLKKNKYDGILYPSTRINETEDNGLLSMDNFNLVYFPKYDDKRHYDSDLFLNLDISTPITIVELEDNDNISIDEFNSLIKIFGEILSKNKESYKNEKFFHMYTIYTNYERKEIPIKEKEYKIEKILVYNFLLKNLLDIQEKIEKENIQDDKW